MKYIKPTYKKEEIETSDIILASLEAGATLTEKGENNAQVGASVLDVLGF